MSCFVLQHYNGGRTGEEGGGGWTVGLLHSASQKVMCVASHSEETHFRELRGEPKVPL